MITYGETHWSLGVIIGLPVLIICVALLLGFGIWLVKTDWDEFDRGLGLFFGWLLIGISILVLIIGILGYYPYSAKYHKWQHVGGEVTSTNSRFLARSGGADQKFVVTFKGSPTQYGCNDTRCATVEVGDNLTITCKAVFQWFGTDGWDCNFISLKRSAE